MRFARRSPLPGLAALSFLACNIANTATAAAYEVRAFGGGPAWFVYDEPVDVALQVLNPDDPKCHEVGEIILLFEGRDQLRDEALIESAALKGMTHYAEFCRSLGASPSNQRRISGIIVGEGAPDARGRVMGDAKVLDAIVSSLTGQPEVRVRRIASFDRDDVNKEPDASEGDRAQAERRRDVALAEIRATYEAALAESMGYAAPVGALGRVAGGDRASLAGAWSGSAAECVTERLILFERNGTGTAQWWRASSDQVGLLPWRSGAWELRDGTLIMMFDRRVDYDDFLGRLRDGPIDETMQFDLMDVDGSELRLAATGGGFSPEASFLGGAEKLFVRCGI